MTSRGVFISPEKLREHARSGMSAEAIGRRYGLSANAVRQRCCKLRIQMASQAQQQDGDDAVRAKLADWFGIGVKDAGLVWRLYMTGSGNGLTKVSAISLAAVTAALDPGAIKASGGWAKLTARGIAEVEAALSYGEQVAA